MVTVPYRYAGPQMLSDEFVLQRCDEIILQKREYVRWMRAQTHAVLDAAYCIAGGSGYILYRGRKTAVAVDATAKTSYVDVTGDDAVIRHWPASWSLSSARMRWGCCTTRNTIRLSWRLIFLDDAVASYVIAHELAHLEHFNHSKVFWKEVERLCPDWRVQLAKLNAAKVLPELEEVGQ